MVTLIYELLYVITFAAGILSISSKFLGLGKAGFILFIIELFLASIFVVLKNGKVTGRLISIGLLSSYTIFILILNSYNEANQKEFDAMGLLWLLAIALLAFLMGELSAYGRAFRVIVSILSFASLVAFTITKYEIGKVYVVAVFSLIIFTVASEIQKRWKKHGDTDMKKHMVYISPFIVATIFFLLISPYSTKPYGWPVVKTAYRFVNRTIQDLRIKASINKNEDYAVSLLGFSEEGSIAGEVKDSRDRVLAVYGIPEETETLKLSGKNFSTFTGREWLETDESTEPDAMFDSIGMYASLSDYTDDPSKYVRWDKLTIQYITMNTDYVFSPSKSVVRESRFPVLSYEIKYDGADIMWPETKSYKTSYSMVYLLTNNESEEFVRFIEEGDTPSKEAYDEYRGEFGVQSDFKYSYENFIKHQESIKETYGKEVVLSNELRNYMDQLYEGCNSDYEKLLRIKQLLKSFEYTKNPGEIPENITNETEFLDYFILDEQRGYCSFYATAFVLLARAEGIPARYVQGYNITVNGSQNKYVYSSSAHAWSEVYFDSAGWIAFDATPGFEGGNYWSGSATSFKLPEMGVYEKKEEDSQSEKEEETEGAAEEKETVSVNWIIIVIPVLSGIAIIVIVYFAVRIGSKIRFNQLDDSKQFVAYCKQVFAILRLLGKPIKEDETLYEYRTRLEKDYYTDRLNFIDELERYLYSGQDISAELDEAKKNAINMRKELLDELKKKRLVKYILYSLKFNS